MRIRTKPSFEPKLAKIYPLPYHQRQALREMIDELKAKGFIKDSESPNTSPFFFIPKKDGTLRPIQDYRYLNSHTIKDGYPMPNTQTLLDQLQGSKYFTVLDIRQGYHNIRIAEEDQWKAAFVCQEGTFQPTVMFFGLCNSPAVFQRFMNDIFAKQIRENKIIVYMDDIMIYATSMRQLIANTLEVFNVLTKHKLYVKPAKCQFHKTEVSFLGYIISEARIRTDPWKIQGILDWQTPKNLKEVRSFTGFTNFYRRFIKDFSKIARPLHALTHKDTPFQWSSACQQAFDNLKHAFTSAPVLTLPDHTCPFRLITDASDFAISAVLEQPDEINRWHPVAFLSKSMTDAERNYDIHDKELLAIICSLETYRHYLQGAQHRVEIWTDHNNLTYFTTKQKLTQRQARWSLELSQYDVLLLRKPDIYNRTDHLSCRPDLKEGIMTENNNKILLDTKFFAIRATRAGTTTTIGDQNLRRCIRESQDKDEEVTKALTTIMKNGPRTIAKGLEDWNYEDGLILHQGKVYIPKDTK